MIAVRAGHSGCILLCAVLAGTGPADAVLDEAATVDDFERLEQAVLGGDETQPESEMRRRVAWALLATGRDRAALRQFARLAGREPDAGGPKIGYALSAAKLGDLTNAARAVRRVLRVDPDALAAVTMDRALHARLETLRTRYMKRLARFDHDRDGAVMLAAVCYLLADPDTARYAIGYLAANGERGRTTDNLDRLVRALAEPPAPEPLGEIVEAAAAERGEAPAPEPAGTPADAPVETPADAPVETPADAPVETPADAPVETPAGAPAEDAMDFTLVYARPETPPPAPAAIPAGGDPWAPASADTLEVDPPAPPAPTPVAIDEVHDRYDVDYDKLREDLGSVGGALDTFTRKLIRNIAAMQAGGEK